MFVQDIKETISEPPEYAVSNAHIFGWLMIRRTQRKNKMITRHSGMMDCRSVKFAAFARAVPFVLKVGRFILADLKL
jgi:hypothetical protein